MTQDEVRKSLGQLLRDLQPDPKQRYEITWRALRPPPQSTLLPDMVFITLARCLDYPYAMKPFEKTLWAIPVCFKGIALRIEHAKFGLRFFTESPDESAPLVSELASVLGRALRLAEQLIQPFVESQIRAGRVTLRNIFVMLEDRYRFLRKHAEAAYESDPPAINVTHRDEHGQPMGWTGDPMKPTREGFYFGSAALDAYFSRLEHFLVLALPFCGFDPAADDLVSLVTMTWGDKFKRIFPLDVDRDAQRLYQKLRDVKERFRNTIAHGGFEKGVSSLFVHFPPVGAVPAQMSEYPDSIHFSMYPIAGPTFHDVCSVFDETDAHLARSRTRFAYKYAGSGLDVAFDAHTVEEYRLASSSDEAFEEFIERQGYFHDMHANMDW
jgi:hypothetical protein